MFNSLMYDLPFAFLIDPFHAINEMFHSIISMFYDLPNSEQLTRTFAIRVAIIGRQVAVLSVHISKDGKVYPYYYVLSAHRCQDCSGVY